MALMFSTLLGILQGCPLSGTLVASAVDPLLWMFRKQVNSAVIRFCADDIGVALEGIQAKNASLGGRTPDNKRVSNHCPLFKNVIASNLLARQHLAYMA